MLTVKFMKYGPSGDGNPTYTEGVCVREAKAVHIRHEADLRTVVQLGDAPGETFEVTVGESECMYSVAYVMNEAGRTIETIR